MRFIINTPLINTLIEEKNVGWLGKFRDIERRI